jgi:phosphopantothenoylcysteine decarboxylase
MKVLLGVTGSVASTLVPKLVNQLIDAGHEVQVVATKWALYFFKPEDVPVKVWTDEDEWPNALYEKDQPIPHIELRDWADVLLLAPLTANTLAKVSHGLCDNLLTSTVRAWCPKKPIIIAPAMNTVMWENPITQEQIYLLRRFFKVTLVEPTEKKLACGQTGKGALARLDTIVEAILNL